MNEEIMQEQNIPPVDNEMSPEETMAALGLSTRLSEQFLMQQAQEQAMMGGGEGMEQMGEMPMEASKTPKMASQSEDMMKNEEMPMKKEKEPEKGKMDEEHKEMMQPMMDEMRGMMERMKDEIITELKKEDGTE